MSAILYAFLIIAGLGALLGVGLAIADKKLSVEKDKKLIQLEESMPNANCGSCGYAGCSAYAEAVFKGEAKPGLCAPGGQALANKMAEIMGVAAEKVEKCYPFVFCNGFCSDKTLDFKYYGVKDCNAAAMLLGGDQKCKEGCLHLGSCVNACEQGALSIDKYGNIVVDRSKCISCGNCAKVCPKGVIRMIPESQAYAVACNSHKKGPQVRAMCNYGCIGCKLCETKFPEAGFKVENFLSTASANGNKDLQKQASQACPRKVIVEVK